MLFLAVSGQWSTTPATTTCRWGPRTVTSRRFGRDSCIDCAPAGGNNLQNSDRGLGESNGRIRAWGLWYPGSPKQGTRGTLNLIKFSMRQGPPAVGFVVSRTLKCEDPGTQLIGSTRRINYLVWWSRIDRRNPNFDKP